jgi:hypothetical protein
MNEVKVKNLHAKIQQQIEGKKWTICTQG